MNQIDKSKSLEESMKKSIKNKDKADFVFNQLLAKQKKPKNPFDEARSINYPIKETKPGADTDDNL